MTARPFQPRQILRALADADVDFVLVGGLAAGAHGATRATGDVDVVLRPEHENYARLARAFETSLAPAEPVFDTGLLDLDVLDPFDLFRGQNYRVATRYGLLDVLNAASGAPPYDDLRAASIEVPIAGVVVRVVALDHLLSMKREAGRPKDLQDIAELTAEDPPA